MEALLSALWLAPQAGARVVPVLDTASLSLVRQEIRAVGAELGLQSPVIESMTTVATELGQNQLRHARAGGLLVRPLTRDGVAGLEVVAADQGPGIADPTTALQGDHSTRGGLGIGLSGARRLADEVDIDVRLGEGTCVWARKFAVPVRRRREVAILGAPLQGERVNGDFAGFLRLPDALLLLVADGLGHGAEARAAAQRAVAAVLGEGDPDRGERSLPLRSPEGLLEVASAALSEQRGCRGAVLGVARWEEPGALPGHLQRLTFAGAGDVAGIFGDDERSERLSSSAWVLGRAGYPRAPRSSALAEQRFAVGAHPVLALFSDGLQTRTALPAAGALRRQHPLILAHHLLRTYSRGTDDALVLVAR